jgi:hypothetical protein
LMSAEPPTKTRLAWRIVGTKRWQVVAATPSDEPALRFTVPFDRLEPGAIEVVLEAVLKGDETVVFPAHGRDQPVWIHGA